VSGREAGYTGNVCEEACDRLRRKDQKPEAMPDATRQQVRCPERLSTRAMHTGAEGFSKCRIFELWTGNLRPRLIEMHQLIRAR
jgi:hypothetical protein